MGNGNFSEAVIKRACGSVYFDRGLRYFKEGRVLSAAYSERTGMLQGRVAGSGGRAYRQRIAIGGGRSGLDGECECPVGHNCKHVAAVALAWLAGTADEPEAPATIKAWQRRLEDRRARRDAEPEETPPGQECLLYRLTRHGHERGVGEIRLDAWRSRRLKQGGWGKPVALDLYAAAHEYFYPPAWLTEADQEIARRAAAGLVYGQPIRIEGEEGTSLLRRLLRTGRCYFDSFGAPPLRLGAARRARFEWIETADRRRLAVTPEDGGPWLVLPTDPPWYLDAGQGLCGPVDQPLDAEVFLALCELPPVPSSELTALARYLLLMLPPDAVPLPVAIEIVTVDAPPVPVLCLRGREDPALGRIHLAEVRFAYEGAELPAVHEPPARTLVSRDGKEWDIRRRPAEELAAVGRLRACGLQPIEGAGPGLEMTFLGRDRAAAAAMWRGFLERLPELEADGWIVRREPSFTMRFETVERIRATVAEPGLDWFSIGLAVEVAGRRVELLPLLAQWLERGGAADAGDSLWVEHEQGLWIEVPASLVRPVAQTLLELYDTAPAEAGQLTLPRQHAARLAELGGRLGDALQWRGGAQVRALGEKLRRFAGIGDVAPPRGLAAELRAYQRQGLAWLQFLREYGFGGVLADDMGLGKTLQALAHLLLEKRAGRLAHPALVVAPTSLLGNWRREAQRFTPGLRTLVLHGPRRHERFPAVPAHDLVITSYPLIARDANALAQQAFSVLILDEAQTVKNPGAKTAQAVRAIQAERRLCLTGTPLENHLGELWALFDFLMPGFLGNAERFRRLYRTPIEDGDDERRQALVERVAPFMLRRTKAQVATELPPKTEIVRTVELAPDQRRLYETIRAAMAERVRALLRGKGLKRSHIEVLDALLKLRQVCCDPRLVKVPSARKVKGSAKLELLMEMLPEMVEEGRAVLVFSQFATMLGHIETALDAAGIGYSKLTGQTRGRDQAIARFQNGGVPVFLVSLKAGGTGLNLTRADTVIHYDPWWNPAAEAQATDRAHRIGQDKPVFVYKLIAEQTVEEKILELQRRKRALADAVLDRRGGDAALNLGAEELLALFAAE